MNNENAQALLKNDEGKNLLKGAILEKSNLYDQLNCLKLSEKELKSLLAGSMTFESLKRIVGHYETLDELESLKRDLSSMCYQLNKSTNKVPTNTKWDQAFEYATEVIQIDEVVSNLIGISNFKRNILCPFHEDKNNPSLKIYTKNNRFVCFACGARGSPVDFVMQYKKCSFKEAVQYITNY